MRRLKREHEDEHAAMEEDFKRQRAALADEHNAMSTVMRTEHERLFAEANNRYQGLVQVCIDAWMDAMLAITYCV